MSPNWGIGIGTYLASLVHHTIVVTTTVLLASMNSNKGRIGWMVGQERD